MKMATDDLFKMDPTHASREELVQAVNDFQFLMEGLRGTEPEFIRLGMIFGTTRAEAGFLSALLRKPRLPFSALCLAGCAGNPRARKEGISARSLQVQMVRLRKKLAPLGITVKSVWGYGYEISREDIVKLNVIIEDYGDKHGKEP